MTEHEESVLRAKTFLKAAVPLVEEVVAADANLQKMIAKWNCAIQLSAKNEEPAAYMLFENGAVKVKQGKHEKPVLTLEFKSLKQMNDTFAGKAKKTDMPRIKGMWHILLLLKTQKLLNSLQMLMPEYVVTTPEQKVLKVKMLLYLVGVALQEMSKGGDEYILRFAGPAHKKVVEWTVALEEPACSIRLDEGIIKCKKGLYGKKPYLGMDFKDIDAAMAVLTNQVSPLEAQASGLVTFRGTPEYGIKAGSLMTRVNNFLMPEEGA